ncbi:MAG: tetratricopeptide repeat protein [Flavobacteriaceae bacterium]|nr:tetratricopeptide repeat protein [Flavobacteriaceae bacterium]
MNWNNYWRELQRRNVIKSGIAYLVAAWLIIQVLSIVLPAFGAPLYYLKWSLILLGIGFPVWLVFSWIYEFTPDGIRKTEDVEPSDSISNLTGNRLNKIIITTLTLAVVLLLIDRFTRDSAEVMDMGEKSLAVLAFADMSPDKDHEYFSDGVSEELLNRLARVPEFRVMSRTSSFSYKGKNTKATTIGKELGVTHILEGSIRKSGNVIRVTAQLTRTKDGVQEWSRTFDRNLDSIFRIQDEIAAAVSEELEISLLGKTKINETPDTNAYNFYLQAMHLFRQNTKESMIQAKEKVEQSIAIDSSYAPSWQLLARIYDTGSYNFSIWEPQEGFSLGIDAINRSLKLDPDSGLSYAVLSSMQEANWKFEESASNMEKALNLEPNNSVIIGFAANMTYGDLDKSVELLNKAIEIDPLVYGNYFNLGHTYFLMNNLEEAEKAFETFAIYYPNWQIYHYMMAKIRLAQGRYEDALKEIDQETHEFFSLYGRNFIYHAMGNTEEADKLFKEFLDKNGETDFANTADLYAFRGQYEEAFEWLEKAYMEKDPVLIEALAYPSFKPMYSDDRWKNFISKLGLPDDHGYPLN